MKFSLEATKRAAKQTGSMDLIEATEGLTSAWESLTAAQRGMEEVCDVMDNIQMSLEHLNKFGDKSVKILNADKSLESLLQLPEKLITADKAQEGLGDAAKKAWETLVEWCTKIWEAIANFCKKIIGFFTSKSDTNEKKIKEIKEKVKKGKKKQPGPVREGGVGGMRDPGEEGLKASLEAKATLAGGETMNFWHIGKYDTADKTIFYIKIFYPEIIMGCSLGILKIANFISGRKTNLEEINDAYEEAINKVIRYCREGLGGSDFAMIHKLELQSSHGLKECRVVFPYRFSDPSGVTEDKLSSSGWTPSSLVSFLNNLEQVAVRSEIIKDKVEIAAKNANTVTTSLSRYIENNDGKLSAARIYLQTASAAAKNLMTVINESMKGYVSIETGLTKVADHASKALGF